MLLASLSTLREHQLLVLWVEVAALVCTGRLLGALLRRVGQPAVVGEIAAGLLLGPSVFGKVWPRGFHWFLPDDPMSGAAIVSLGWMGAALLLVVTGFETDLTLIRRFGGAAVLVATGSLVVPLAGGFALGWFMPARFAGAGHSRFVFALFIATALSISSLPVIAKILGELDLLRRDFGQITLAAGMSNDTVGWLLLGILSGLASSGRISVGHVLLTVAGMSGFLVLAFLVGQRAIDRALRRTRAEEGGVASGVTVSVVAMVLFAVAAQALGLEAVLGAFVAGILLGRSRFQHEGVHEQLGALTHTLFAPLFFATAGLRVDLGLLGTPQVLWWSLAVLVVASAAKFAGSVGGARLARRSSRESLALGAGLNARGAMEVIIASVGLGLGVLDSSAYTAIVLMAIVTSVLAPPTLRLALRDWRGSEEERARLEREESFERNLVVKDRRILLPSRGLPNSVMAAQILHLAWPAEAPVTVLSVADEDRVPEIGAVVDLVAERRHEVRNVTGLTAVDAIVEEAKLGFGVIGLGVTDDPPPGVQVSELADELLRRTDIPMVIVRRAHDLDTVLPGVFARALVPVSGSRSSRAAQEVAFNLAGAIGTDIVLAHVVDTPSDGIDHGERRAPRAAAHAAQRSGELVVERAARFGADLGVDSRSTVRCGPSVADELIACAGDVDADLVVLGASPHQVENRTFLGHTVEAVLARCPATVVVVTVPEDVA